MTVCKDSLERVAGEQPRNAPEGDHQQMDAGEEGHNYTAPGYYYYVAGRITTHGFVHMACWVFFERFPLFPNVLLRFSHLPKILCK